LGRGEVAHADAAAPDDEGGDDGGAGLKTADADFN
jgi:hypothetical protein